MKEKVEFAFNDQINNFGMIVEGKLKGGRGILFVPGELYFGPLFLSATSKDDVSVKRKVKIFFKLECELLKGVLNTRQTFRDLGFSIEEDQDNPEDKLVAYKKLGTWTADCNECSAEQLTEEFYHEVKNLLPLITQLLIELVDKSILFPEDI